MYRLTFSVDEGRCAAGMEGVRPVTGDEIVASFAGADGLRIPFGGPELVEEILAMSWSWRLTFDVELEGRFATDGDGIEPSAGEDIIVGSAGADAPRKSA